MQTGDVSGVPGDTSDRPRRTRTPLREQKLFRKPPTKVDVLTRGGPPAPGSLLAPQPRHFRFRINRLGIVLAILIAAGTVPFILRDQQHRVASRSRAETDYSIPPEKRQWRMHGLDGITDKEAIRRFGEPMIQRNYNVADGAFAGPAIGQKHFYYKTAPDFRKVIHDAEITWTFPQYSVVREIIWKLPDSYLTLWFREPRAEVQLSGDSTDITLPTSDAGGDWVCLDNYRVGNDLIKPPGNS